MLGAFGAGYSKGRVYEQMVAKADAQPAQQLQQEKTKVVDTHREAVAVDREASRERIRIVYRDLKQASETGAVQVGASGVGGDDAACGLNADGMHLWNAANRATAEAVRSEPDYAVSTAPAAVEWRGGGDVAEPHRGDGAIRPVPRPAGEVGGVQP